MKTPAIFSIAGVVMNSGATATDVPLPVLSKLYKI